MRQTQPGGRGVRGLSRLTLMMAWVAALHTAAQGLRMLLLRTVRVTVREWNRAMVSMVMVWAVAIHMAAQDAAPSDCRIDIQRMEPCNGLGGRGLETGQSGKGLRRSNEAKMPQPKC